MKNDLAPIVAEHWKEMPFDPDLPLSLHQSMYEIMDVADRLLIVTVRDGGRLVGYFANFVSRHPHYDLLTAAMDVYFLLPEYRNAVNGLRLFRAMEEACRKRGVEYMLATARLDRGPVAMKMFERLGWAPARMAYQKRLN